MYNAISKLDEGFAVTSTSKYNQNYSLKMNEEADGPMELFTVAFSACILMCVKGYFFRKYNLFDLSIEIDLKVDYEAKNCHSIITVARQRLSEEDKNGILKNINLRCKISHLLSSDIKLSYEIKTA